VDNDTIDKIKNRLAELEESYRQYPNIVVLAEIIELNYQYREIDQTEGLTCSIFPINNISF